METPPRDPGDRLTSIVAATDLSDAAATAHSWAVEIAVEHQARLYLAHALHLAGWATDYLEIDASIPAEIEETGRDRLQRLADQTRQRHGATSWDLLTGVPSDAILELVAERRADLVVVGTRGRKGLESLLLGSTARRIVQRAPCPVLTVCPDSESRQQPVRRILVATDFSHQAIAALSTASELLRVGHEDTEIVLLHAYLVPYDLLPSDGYVSAASGLQQWQTAQRDVEARLQRQAAALSDAGMRVSTFGIEGYPPDIIVEQAVRHRVDLIAMGTHGRTGLAHTFLGSIAEKVIHRAPCPVLTVRNDVKPIQNGGSDAGREAQEVPE